MIWSPSWVPGLRQRRRVADSARALAAGSGVRPAVASGLPSLCGADQPEGIERYLGSGMVKGIGPVYAKKLVDKFGGHIFDIIENYSPG